MDLEKRAAAPPEDRRDHNDLGCQRDHSDITAEDKLAQHRLELLVERVHQLGPRPLYELLAEIAAETGERELIRKKLERYAELDPRIVEALGADGFPPSIWRAA